MKNPLSIVIILLWLLLGIFYWHNHSECCTTNNGDLSSTASVSTTTEGDTNDAITSDNVVTKKLGPLVFNWDKADPITNEGWTELKSQILANLGSEKVLEIIGRYRSDERNDTSFENLGLARAAKVREMHFADLPDDRVRLLGKLIDEDAEDRSNPFESCDFDYKVNNANIKEIDDKTLIYFPFNSTNKLNDAKVEAYLDDVADRVKKTGERVVLVGHTDNIGSTESNITLGQRRADIIKNYLISKGVSEAKINTTSAGEDQPVADNGSSQGRAQNRRTELQILK